MDTTLTFFTTASLLCFFEWYRRGQDKPKNLKKVEVKVEEKAKTWNLWIYGFYVGMALATLAKGPVGFILPLCVSLISLIVQKDWGSLKRMRLLSGMALFLVIVLLWYLPALFKGGEDYLQATLFRHSIDRYAQGWSKGRPIYYYLYNFPIDFLPWVFFIPAAVAYGFSREKVEKRGEFLFLFMWFALIFIFFSLSKGKRAIYLLPLYPAVSLMVGKLWDDFISTPMDHFRNAWIFVPLYGLMGVALVAGAALPWVVSMKFHAYLLYSLPVSFILIGGSLSLFFLNRFKYHGAIFFLIVGIIAGGFFYTLRVVFPLVNPYKSAPFISQQGTSRVPPGEKLGVYGGFGTEPYNFYTGI